jgi:hypothetical protein
MTLVTLSAQFCLIICHLRSLLNQLSSHRSSMQSRYDWLALSIKYSESQVPGPEF